MTYSMLPKDSLDHIKAKITIGNPTDTRKFTFETKILSFETSKDEAVKMGQYMCLQDSQIKPFKQGNLIRGIVNWSGVALSVVQGSKHSITFFFYFNFELKIFFTNNVGHIWILFRYKFWKKILCIIEPGILKYFVML